MVGWWLPRGDAQLPLSTINRRSLRVHYWILDPLLFKTPCWKLQRQQNVYFNYTPKYYSLPLSGRIYPLGSERGNKHAKKKTRANFYNPSPKNARIFMTPMMEYPPSSGGGGQCVINPQWWGQSKFNLKPHFTATEGGGVWCKDLSDSRRSREWFRNRPCLGSYRDHSVGSAPGCCFLKCWMARVVVINWRLIVCCCTRPLVTDDRREQPDVIGREDILMELYVTRINHRILD